MKWTTDKPNAPGFYWCHFDPIVAKGVKIFYFEKCCPAHGDHHDFQPDNQEWSTEAFDKFAGPIPEPKEKP